jgi:hypothetical protein
VIDAEDVPLGKGALQCLVEFLRALQVLAEGLLDDEAAAHSVLLAGEPGSREVLRGWAEIFRRGGEIEQIVSANLRALRNLVQLLRELPVRFHLVEFALEIIDVLREFAPDFFIDRLGMRKLPQRLAQIFPKLLITFGTPRETNDGSNHPWRRRSLPRLGAVSGAHRRSRLGTGDSE